MATDPILDTPRCVQDLHQQMNIQHATWRIQRIGWWVMLAFSLAGLAGLLGDGPLLVATAQSGEAEVKYNLVLRRQSDAHINFAIPSQRGRAVLTLPASYLEAVELDGIQPEPVVAFSGPDGQTFIFSSPQPRAQVTLKIRPRKIGPLKFAPAVNGLALPTHYPLVLP